MKKILFISTRYPFPIFGGDKIRAVGILRHLSKKNKIDLICLNGQKNSHLNQIKFCNNVKVFRINFIKRLIYTITSFLKFEPLQVGFYFSEKNVKETNKSRTFYSVKQNNDLQNLPLLKNDTSNIIEYRNDIEAYKKSKKN